MSAAGAEHYVVAQLMFRDIDAFKYERGRAGTDVVAADTKCGSSVSIQVKGRYFSSAGGFPIKRPKADFVVFARLNLDLSLSNGEAWPPECYAFPQLWLVGSLKLWAELNVAYVSPNAHYAM